MILIHYKNIQLNLGGSIMRTKTCQRGLNKKILIIPVLLLCIGSASTNAKTINVATWGSFNVSCGSKSNPCGSIDWALAFIAVTKDKVLVQPGIYTGNIKVAIEGIKLESVAGYSGTILEAANASDHVIDIQAPKVRIGKKGKGFTVRGASATGFAGINVNSNLHSRIKLEGNLATGNYIGFNLQGEKLQVRGNHVVNTTGGDGIHCTHCERALFQDNKVIDAGADGLELSNSSSVSIFRNLIRNPLSNGILLVSNSDFAKIKENVVIGSTDAIDTGSNSNDGVLIQSNIVSENSSLGIYTNSSGGETKPQTIKYNLSVDSGSGNSFDHGFDIQAESGLPIVFVGNTAVLAHGSGVELDEGTEVKSFSNNNTYASYGGIGVLNNSGEDFSYSKHFWGHASGQDPDGADVDMHDTLDDGGSVVTGSDATNPNPINATKVAGL